LFSNELHGVTFLELLSSELHRSIYKPGGKKTCRTTARRQRREYAKYKGQIYKYKGHNKYEQIRINMFRENMHPPRKHVSRKHASSEKTCFEKICFEKTCILRENMFRENICFEKTCILREQIHGQSILKSNTHALALQWEFHEKREK
jgi:hypothetical protein